LKLCGDGRLGERLILASGFFQQGLWGYEILADALLGAITNGRSGIKTVDVIGAMAGHGAWLGGFNRFVQRLRNVHQFAVTARIARTRKWHAKIAMRLDEGAPTAAIIGSSNLTRPSYAVAPVVNNQGWNYECDVTLWKNKELNKVFRDVDEIPDDRWIIAAIRDPKIRQPTEAKKLQQLFAQVELLTERSRIVRNPRTK